MKKLQLVSKSRKIPDMRNSFTKFYLKNLILKASAHLLGLS